MRPLTQLITQTFAISYTIDRSMSLFIAANMSEAAYNIDHLVTFFIVANIVRPPIPLIIHSVLS